MAYSGVVTGPPQGSGGYPAPNGHRYFEVLGVPPGLPETRRDIGLLIQRCRAEAASSRDSAARAFWLGWETKFKALNAQVESRLRTIANQTAQVAETAIKEWIDATQVRPDTNKVPGLRDNIAAHAVPTVPHFGMVGVGDMARLNQTRRTGRGDPYWAAQEFGTDAHVGRIVHGYFMPGRNRPSQAQFRVHPEFQAGRGGRMVIGRAIEERAFLRRGTEDAGRFRERKIAALEQDVIRVMLAFKAARKPRPGGGTPGPGGTRNTRRR